MASGATAWKSEGNMRSDCSLLLTAIVLSMLACNLLMPRPAGRPAQTAAAPQPSANSNPAPVPVGDAIPCPGEQPSFVTDGDVRQVPALDQPAVRIPIPS